MDSASYMSGTLNALTRQLYAYHNPSAPAVRRARRVLTFTQNAIYSAQLKGGIIDYEALEHLVKWAVVTVNKATKPHRHEVGLWGGAIHAELLAEVKKEKGECHGVMEGEVDGFGAYAPSRCSPSAVPVPSDSASSVTSEVAVKPLQVAAPGIAFLSSEVSDDSDGSETDSESGGILLPQEVLEMLGGDAVKDFYEEMCKWESDV